MTLLSSLLDFAASSRAHEEDPITEILAWLLRADDALRADFLALVRGVTTPSSPPAVLTQVVRPGVRYDLVFEWALPARRLIIEVKVGAGLTYGEHETESGPMHADQVSRYLALAEGEAAHVLTLASGPLDLPLSARAHERFAGELRWQEVHDAIVRRLTDRPESIDPEARGFARQFVTLLEERRMAAPKLTFDGLTATYRFFAFRDAIVPILEHARDEVFTGPLAQYLKPSSRGYDDKHARLGFKVWATADDPRRFAFVGLHVGAKPIHEDVPDLYLFLEAAPTTARHAELVAAAAAKWPELEAASTGATRWSVGEGWQLVTARRSLVEAMRAADPAGEIRAFFVDGFAQLAKVGLLDLLRA